MRHRVRGQADQYIEIQVAVGDRRARERLIAEMDDFTGAVPLSPELLARFREAAPRLDEDRWTTTDEVELDQVVAPFFCSSVAFASESKVRRMRRPFW